jgi:hypothetical protein
VPEHLGVQTRSVGRAHDNGPAFGKRLRASEGTPGFRDRSFRFEYIALTSALRSRSGFGMALDAVQIWDSSDAHSATTMTYITCLS